MPGSVQNPVDDLVAGPPVFPFKAAVEAHHHPKPHLRPAGASRRFPAPSQRAAPIFGFIHILNIGGVKGVAVIVKVIVKVFSVFLRVIKVMLVVIEVVKVISIFFCQFMLLALPNIILISYISTRGHG